MERWHRVVRDQFLSELTSKHLQSLEELNAYLWAWVESLYHRRPHSALNGITLQRWQKDLSIMQSLGRYAPHLDELFYHRIQRKVRKDGTVSFRGQRFESPYELSNRTVQLIVDPHGEQAIAVESLDGEPLGQATPLDLIANSHRRRQQQLIWIIDEVQNLPKEFFQDFPGFLNFAFDTRDLMTVWLVGQSVLAQTLGRAPYAALNSRIQVRIRMQAIIEHERFAALVNHAFKEVGCQQQLLADSGIDLLRQAAQGNPRQAGLVIKHAMCLAVPKGLNHLPDDLIQQAIEELRVTDEQDITDWFAEDLTDEAAYSIHLFLTEFTLLFETQYYGLIRRHIQSFNKEEQHQQTNSSSPLEDYAIPF